MKCIAEIHFKMCIKLTDNRVCLSSATMSPEEYTTRNHKKNKN